MGVVGSSVVRPGYIKGVLVVAEYKLSGLFLSNHFYQLHVVVVLVRTVSGLTYVPGFNVELCKRRRSCFT